MILQVGARNEYKAPKERSHDSALVVTEYFKRDMELDYTNI